MARRDIVVIGASAGGVRALRVVAAALPADFAAAVCVVLHVGAFRSNLPELLEAVDPLFRSAALSHGPRVIGVLLTGGLDDGTAGLHAIKECGGLAVVQDPADAEDPGMPGAAMQVVEVDHCVPLDRIAPLLVELVRQPAPAVAGEPPSSLVHEHQAGLGGENAMDDLEQVAAPSTLVCPDCKGTLWEILGAKPPRYRCHTGHAFSLRSLAAVQQETTENALWSAVRALVEQS